MGVLTYTLYVASIYIFTWRYIISFIAWFPVQFIDPTINFLCDSEDVTSKMLYN